MRLTRSRTGCALTHPRAAKGRPGAWGMLLLCLVCLGCVPGIPMTEGESIAKDNVHQIVVGRTSKWDLMEWFGPPAAIIRPASHVVKIPASRSGRSMAETGGDWTQGIRHGGFYYAQPVVFLECVDRNALASHERIYYFMHSWYMQYALIALGPLEFGGTELDELVVVVNEETQKVEAFFHYDAE